MIHISLMTWRLGNITSKAFEEILYKIHQKDQHQLYIEEGLNDVFFLESCQRIIVATSKSKFKSPEFYLKWTDINNIEPLDIVEPEWFHGTDALFHLGEAISGLDSAVIGEEQIHGQFRESYINSQVHMTSYLQEIFEKILRTGKRVRQRSLLETGKISTISIIVEFLEEIFETSEKIAVIGTGKMSKGILSYLGQNFDGNTEIQVFSTSPIRIGEKIGHHQILSLDKLESADIVLTATSKSGVIDDEFVNIRNFKGTIFIDLGMPRNCNLKDYNHHLYTLEKIVNLSKKEDKSNIVKSAYDVLKDELDKIERYLIKRAHSDHIKKLREEMMHAANERKEMLLTTGLESTKELDQLVNTLIHISQEHLENILLDRDELSEMNYN